MTGDEAADQPSTAESLEDFLTIDELAAYLQIPKNTIYYWRTQGQGPEAHRVGKHLRFYKPEVITWLLAQPARSA